MAPKPAVDRRTRKLASALTPAWLAAQRWFRAKSRRLVAVELDDAAPLGEGPGWLLVLAATDDTGAEARYLVPVVREDDGFREPRDGEGVWRRLAGLVAANGELRAGRGLFSFRAQPALADLLPGGASAIVGVAERRLGVEQSNTSIVLGDRLILKCYRLLEPGVNPEIEVNAFLTAVRFRGAPALGGSAEYLPDGGQPCTTAMLQELVAAETNGWSWALACLAGGPRDREQAIVGLGQIGTLTRELHDALGSHAEVPGFPMRTATSGELATWHSRAEGQLEKVLATLEGDPHRRLLAVAPAIRERLAAIRGARGAQVTRIHGDYHLGQLLRTPTGFTVIDFEGEPARPMAERREPASPLRDVAGMLRSIDYVAHVAQRESGLAEPEAWADNARGAFLSSYGDVARDGQRLLDAFEIEKACYEVGYEANNRPDWVWIPLEALKRLAGMGR